MGEWRSGRGRGPNVAVFLLESVRQHWLVAIGWLVGWEGRQGC